MYVLTACMFVCHVRAWVLLRSEASIQACPGTGVMDGCKSPSGCCWLNLGLLQEHGVFLSAEPSSQHYEISLKLLYFPVGSILSIVIIIDILLCVCTYTCVWACSCRGALVEAAVNSPGFSPSAMRVLWLKPRLPGLVARTFTVPSTSEHLCTYLLNIFFFFFLSLRQDLCYPRCPRAQRFP